MAPRHIEQAAPAGRVDTRVGDLRTDHFGEGYDLVLVSAICHMLDEKENVHLIERCFDAPAPGGRLAQSPRNILRLSEYRIKGILTRNFYFGCYSTVEYTRGSGP